MVRRGEAEKHGKRIGQRVAVGEGPRVANQKGFDRSTSFVDRPQPSPDADSAWKLTIKKLVFKNEVTCGAAAAGGGD